MRPAAFLCALIVLVCPAVPAQRVTGIRPPLPATTKPVPTGSITGQVLCGDTRRPARGAVVMLQPLPEKEREVPAGGNHMARTGPDGSYTLRDVPVGTYAVIALLPGYLSPFDGVVLDQKGVDAEKELLSRLRQSASVGVRAGAESTRDLVLERGAAVSGRVLYPDGAPVTQASILLENMAQKPASAGEEPALDMGAMMRNFLIHQQTGTDDQGHFRLSGLTPGSYRIAAVPAAEVTRAGDFGAVFSGMMADPTAMHVYAGNTLHQKEAKVYDLRAGDEVSDVEITLPIDSFHTVTGRVAAKDGRVLNQANLKLTDSTDGTLVFRSALNPDGTFRFASVPPGSYLLSVTGGHILTPHPNLPPGGNALLAGTPSAVFADGSLPVLVKDSAVEDVQVTLDEVPLPKQEKPGVPAPASGDDPD